MGIAGGLLSGGGEAQGRIVDLRVAARGRTS